MVTGFRAVTSPVLGAVQRVSVVFSAFARLPDNTTKPLDSIDALADVWAQDGALVWADMEAPTQDELSRLGRMIGANEAALEDCLRGEQHPRIIDQSARDSDTLLLAARELARCVARARPKAEKSER